jgi:site-specific recombinase XerD
MEVKLLDRARATIRMRHYSRRTEQAYSAWIRRFIVFHGKRHPRDLGEREVTAFVSHLAERGVSASTQNQALSAILFLFEVVLGERLGWMNEIVRAQRPVKDINFDRGELTIRDGKGGKGRVTMLPAAVKGPLLDHLARVKAQHDADLAAGRGSVALPGALRAKYPNAPGGVFALSSSAYPGVFPRRFPDKCRWLMAFQTN